MADEVYVSAHADLLQSEVLAQELRFLLHQMPFMRDLCQFEGDIRDRGTGTIKVAQVDKDDIAGAVAEGAAPANTAVTDASFTVAPGRQAIRRTLSDFMEIQDQFGFANEVALAAYNFSAVMKRFDALVAAAFASFTGSVGTTTQNMTATDWFSAKQTAITRRWRGRQAMVLFPQQFADLQNDTRGEVGPWQLSVDVQEMVKVARGDNFLGIMDSVEIWTSDQVATANGGADSNGAFFNVSDGMGSSALAYAEGSPTPVTMGRGRIMAQGGVIYTDVGGGSDTINAESTIVTNYFVGVSVAEADRGIGVITDR